MISNQILQNTIDGLKGIARVDFCVLDTEGKELAATFDNGQDRGEAVLSFVESPADSQVIQGCQFFKIFDEQRLEYVLLADGDSEDVYMLGKIAAFQIQSPSGIPLAFFLGQALIFRSETYIGNNIHFKKLILRILKHKPHLPSQLSHIIALFIYAASVIVHRSRRSFNQSVQMLNQGGFSGTGMSDNSHKLSLGDLKIYIFQRALLISRPLTVYIIHVF